MPTRDHRLRLTFEVQRPLGGSSVPAVTVAAALTDLAVLYDFAAKAWDFRLPVTELLAAAGVVDRADLEAPATSSPDHAAYLWTAARLLPEGDAQPPAWTPMSARGSKSTSCSTVPVRCYSAIT